eukprot:5435929-Pleurochrysis_carterae.AAC.1
MPCDVRCCLDLAAARGMRCSRGKTACLCACSGKKGRQQLPGDGDIPSIPAGNTIAEWRAV